MFRMLCALYTLATCTEQTKSPVYVGIDLGTTFSCVSLFNPKTKQYEYLHFSGDNPETVPSVVYVDEEKKDGVSRVHVGYDAVARNRENPNPSNYFFGFKRLMGIPYGDKIVKDFRESVTYRCMEFVPTRGAEPIVVFPAQHSDKSATNYSPTDLSALVLGKIFSMITKTHEIIATVVTTPAYFSVNQDTQTRLAAEHAGFERVTISKEPTAACIEYAQTGNMRLDVEERILVFDLGGGTFDISIVEVENEKENQKLNSSITVAKYVGDNFLGGENVNNALYDHFRRQIGRELTGNEALRLRLFVEQLKIRACTAFAGDSSATVKEKFFDRDGKEFVFALTEPLFDELAAAVYGRIDELLFDRRIGLFRQDSDKEALDKPVKLGEIQKIVLVGGSTRIPYIKRYLKKKFKGASIHDEIDADKSVAAGACKMCVNADASSGEQSVMLLNATTLPIGIAVHDGSFKAVMRKDVVIPTEAYEIFSTVEDNQTRITLQVATGVRPLFSQNHHIGTFELELKEPRPRGVPRIEVRCSMSAEYVLTVTATDLDTTVSSSKVFQANYVGTDKKMVQEILENAKKHETEDAETKAQLEQMHLFTRAVELYEKQLKDATGLSEDQRLKFETTIQTYREWQKENKDKVKSEEIEFQIRELEKEAKELAAAVAESKEEKKEKEML